MNAYDWTNKPVPTGSAAAGLIDTDGMSSLKGVHTSDLAQGASASGVKMQPEAYYSAQFLERKRLKGEDLVFAGYADAITIPVGQTTINLRKYLPLKAHTVALIEGKKPNPDKAAGKAITANTRQYGRYTEWTDLFEVKVADPVMQEYTNEMADLAVETIDLLAQAALLAEAQVFFPSKSGATNIAQLVTKSAAASADDAATVRPSIEDLRIIALTMDAAKVATIGGTYHVLMTPAVKFDLVSELKALNLQASGTNNAYSGTSLPDIYGLSFVTARSARVSKESNGLTGTDLKSAMVHHTFVLGAKAFKRVEIAGNGNTQFFVKGLGSAGTADPLNQRTTMGWKINALSFKVVEPDAVVDYLTIPSQSEIITTNFEYADDFINPTPNMPENNGITTAMIENLTKVLGEAAGVTGADLPTLIKLIKGNIVLGADGKAIDSFGALKADGTAATAEHDGKFDAKDISILNPAKASK